jgi:hypothetical protein
MVLESFRVGWNRFAIARYSPSRLFSRVVTNLSFRILFHNIASLKALVSENHLEPI